jgi:hypothetical protein
MTMPANFTHDVLTSRLTQLSLHVERAQSELETLEKIELDFRFDFSVDEATYKEHSVKISRAIDAVKTVQTALTTAVQALINFHEQSTPLAPTH